MTDRQTDRNREIQTQTERHRRDRENRHIKTDRQRYKHTERQAGRRHGSQRCKVCSAAQKLSRPHRPSCGQTDSDIQTWWPRIMVTNSLQRHEPTKRPKDTQTDRQTDK